MDFTNRQEAGKLLAERLKKYQGKDAIVFALPRGGVIIGKEISKALNIPLDIILAHKIGHPYQPEYAIAAISEDGSVIENETEVSHVDSKWYEDEKNRQLSEIQRRRKEYMKNKKIPVVEGKIALLVDDGIATGLTMKAAILDLIKRKPKKIIVAVPVAPLDTAEQIQRMVDEFIGLEVANMLSFRGAIGAYYRDFLQVEDKEVIEMLT